MSSLHTGTDIRIHIVCPHCQSINRVPRRHLGEHPGCGTCQQPLFTARPIELTAANFELHAAHNDIPLVVDFWASSCGPSKAMEPAYEHAAIILEPHYRLGKVNAEIEQALATRHGIRSIPTLALFRGGREITRQSGAVTVPKQIAQWARSRIVPP